MPHDGPILLPQMVAVSLPTPQEIVATGINTDALLDLMLAKLTDPAHRRPDLAQAFCHLLRPSLHRLLNDTAFVGTLAPGIFRDLLSMRETAEDTNRTVHNMAATLQAFMVAQSANSRAGIDSIPLADLAALAQSFGAAEGLGKAALIPFLTDKAADIKRLSA